MLKIKRQINLNCFVRLNALLIFVCILFLGCSCQNDKAFSYDVEKNIFPLFKKSYNLDETDIWLVVFDCTRDIHISLFDHNGIFIHRRNKQTIYKMSPSLKENFYQITSDPTSFEDSSVEVTKEKFAFIFVQSEEVVQVVSPDIEGGNLGDFPTIPKDSYDLSSWSKQGINRIIELANKVVKLESPFKEKFPYRLHVKE